MANFKSEVLKAFKALHKSRIQVFGKDEEAQKIMQQYINEEFKKNKTLDDQNKIEELIRNANILAVDLKKSVIQAEELRPGYYRLNITDDHIVEPGKYNCPKKEENNEKQ